MTVVAPPQPAAGTLPLIFERGDLLVWAPVAVLMLTAGIAWQWRRGRRLVDAFGGPAAARRLVGRSIGRFPVARIACVVPAALAIVLAAGGVARDPGDPAPPSAPVDLIVALDVSHSMSASDVEPSRASRAKRTVQRILDERVADRVALTLFAGWPYGLVPITDDLNVVDFFLPSIEPELVGQRDQGTALAATVAHAARTWSARARSGAIPVLLILSDGEVHGNAPAVLDSVHAAAVGGLRIWTAGVGTDEGGPLFVPRSGGAPLLEGSGEQAVAGYEPDLLREIADRGGGAFHDVGDDDGIAALVSDLRNLAGERAAQDATPFDPTAWLLLIALSLLCADLILDAPPRRRGRPAHGEGGA